MSSAATGGLGKGLAAILTGPEAPSEQDTLRSRLVQSAMSSLSGPRTLQLCGYVHDAGGDVSVTLQSPTLGSLHPTEAYELFTSLGMIGGRPDGRHDFRVGELAVFAVSRTIDQQRALFFFGDDTLTAEENDRLSAFCGIYAPVVLEHDTEPRQDERVHLVLDQDGGTVHAEVDVGGRVGFGSAERTHHAAAQAALSALSAKAKLVEVGEVRAQDGAASFVVAAGEMGRIGMGAAPVAAGPDAAAAIAAIRAARALAA